MVSNDSDFGALFVKVRELAAQAACSETVPFLWNTPLPTPELCPPEIEQFIPDRLSLRTCPMLLTATDANRASRSSRR